MPVGNQHRLRELLSATSWPKEIYYDVARQFVQGMHQAEYSAEDIAAVLKRWRDFVERKRPDVRKAAVWAAALEYLVASRYRGVRKEELAQKYGASTSGLTRCARLIELEFPDSKLGPWYGLEQVLSRIVTANKLDELVDEQDPAVLYERLRRPVDELAEHFQLEMKRAEKLFFSNIQADTNIQFWWGCFLDYYHFDWRIRALSYASLPDLLGLYLAREKHPFAATYNNWSTTYLGFYKVLEVIDDKQIRLRDLFVKRERVVYDLAAAEHEEGQIKVSRLLPIRNIWITGGHAFRFPEEAADVLWKMLADLRARVKRQLKHDVSWHEFALSFSHLIYAMIWMTERSSN